MIVPRKSGFFVVSEKTGRNLGGPYKSKEEAQNRLKQVEFFKHVKPSGGKNDASRGLSRSK